jgi:PilZ domain
MSLSEPKAASTDATNTEDQARERKARFSNRKPGASAAALHSDELSGAVTCVVKDMSVSGARIAFTSVKPKLKDGTPGLPDRLTLHIRVDRVAIECRPVWHVGSEAGLKFVSAPRVLERRR